MAASTTNPSISSKFFGSQVLLSPPTPKTTRSLPFLSRKKFLIAQSILNKPNYSHILKDLPSQATLAALFFSSITPQALAINESVPPPNPPSTLIQAEAPSNSSPFSQILSLTAPKPQSSDLPEGSQWRYSEFLNDVKKGKVERVRFNKDGGALQLTAVDGRRSSVVVPNDPECGLHIKEENGNGNGNGAVHANGTSTVADILNSQCLVNLSRPGIENLVKMEDRKEAWLVVLYAPWCRYCQAMDGSYVELAEKLAGTGVQVGKFRADGDQKAFAQEELQLGTFPTILFFPKHSPRAVKYPSEKRDVDSLMAFVNALR